MNVIKNLDALLITCPTNIRYLTGFVGVSPEEREAYVLLTPNQTFLFTNALYREAAKKLTSLKRLNLLGTKGLTFIEISREEPFAKKLKKILSSVIPTYVGIQSKKSWIPGQARNDRIRLGFEEHDLTVAEYHKIMLEHKNVTLVPTQERVEKLRIIKREDEIENIRRAANLTDQCFDFILGKLKPGITENAIAWEIESFIRTRGAELAFSPIVAFGKNTSQPHYSPNFTRPRLEIEARQGEALKNKDIILLDFGARVNGYCSDMTRVVFVGKPKEEWKKAYETVLEAQQQVLAQLTNSPHSPSYAKRGRGGVTGAQLDRLARGVIKNAGFPAYPHSLGHGVGLAIHEAPRLTVKKNATLKPNMVVTVEPAIYIEGRYGIRIEDLILLKKEGIKMLSQSKKEMIIL